MASLWPPRGAGRKFAPRSPVAITAPEFFGQRRGRESARVDGFKGHEQRRRCCCRIDTGYKSPKSFAARDHRLSAGS